MFQSIEEDKNFVEQTLSASEKARVDLQKVLNETSVKTKQELSKLEQYQEIMLQENHVVSEQLTENRLTLQAKE